MALIEIDWHPGRRQLRRFGVTMLVGFAAVAVIAEVVAGHRELAIVLAAVGAVTGSIGLTGTVAALWVYRAWMAIAFVLGNVTSRVLIAVFYYGMITPIGLVMRLAGRDRLQRRNRRASYWTDLPPPSADPRRYERQF